MAGRLRVRAGRMVKTGNTRKQELEKYMSKGKTLVGLTNSTNWQQTENTENKYTEDNGEDW
jgi:hypothetical protein